MLQRIGFDRPPLPRFRRMDAELARLDAVGLAEAIRTGQLSPAEALESSIRRMEAVDGDINAVIHRHLDEARASIDSLPDGPFRGVPMLMKDLWAAKPDVPITRASRRSRITEPSPTGLPSRRGLPGAGFVSFGRTNTPSSAPAPPPSRSPTGRPTTRGISRGREVRRRRSRCGRCRCAAGGQRSDGGGSIRIPAAMCGLVGLKPSRGRISMGPHMDEWGNSVQHVVCHTVRDSAAILDATIVHVPGDGVIAPRQDEPYADLVGRDPGRLRIGFLDHAIRTNTEIDPDVADAVRATAARLEALGHHVEPSVPAPLLDESRITAWGPAFAAGTAASVAAIAARSAESSTTATSNPGPCSSPSGPRCSHRRP